MGIQALLKEFRQRGAVHIIEGARAHAERLNAAFVSADHLALALLDQPAGYPSRVLDVLGIDISELLEELGANRVPKQGVRQHDAELPFTNLAVAALRSSLQWARANRRTGFESLGLLLAIAQDRKTEMAIALQSRKISLSDLSSVVHSLLPGNSSGTDNNETPFHITISDTDARPYHQQIVDCIRQAVATDRLRAGDRVPSIRSLSDQLAIAPGTVARAYRELEEADLLITDGARGSFVALQRAFDLKSSLALTETSFRSAVTAGLRMGLKPIQLRECFEAILRSA